MNWGTCSRIIIEIIATFSGVAITAPKLFWKEEIRTEHDLEKGIHH